MSKQKECHRCGENPKVEIFESKKFSCLTMASSQRTKKKQNKVKPEEFRTGRSQIENFCHQMLYYKAAGV